MQQYDNIESVSAAFDNKTANRESYHFRIYKITVGLIALNTV